MQKKVRSRRQRRRSKYVGVSSTDFRERRQSRLDSSINMHDGGAGAQRGGGETSSAFHKPIPKAAAKEQMQEQHTGSMRPSGIKPSPLRDL